MGDAGRWWPRLSVAGVLAVLAVAAVAGLRPASGIALAARSTGAPTVTSASAEPAPAAILAPIAARQAIASRGDVAYELIGSAPALEDIPTHALAAYQRAATVIDLADDSCDLDWQLLAALGKVLTDDGRVGGAELDENGVPRPWVVGERLTGRHGTQRVPDTDSGSLDRDKRLDRAVGPMLLLPGVWSVVSVDGDGDGRRNPQDVDDAALGAAVLLCAGPGDLSKAAHRRSEVRRFHPGTDYTRSVLGVRAAYLDAELPSPVSLLAREMGVSVPTPTVEGADAPAVDQSYSGSTSFQPGAGPSSRPTPLTATASPTGGATPTGAPSSGQSPSQTPSESQSPSASPSECSSPSESANPTASPTATPTDCPTATPTPAEPTPTAVPTVRDDPSPTAAVAVPGAVLAPLAGLLWWRRRRTPAGEARSTV
jgi:hypothetical protein